MCLPSPPPSLLKKFPAWSDSPAGVTVIVKDYDVEGVEQEWLTKDDEGNYYVESTWTPEK